MPYYKLKSLIVSIVVLTTVSLPPFAWAQSGRGRPRVPGRDPAPTSPQPVKVPKDTEVIKQDQIGTTSRFLLRNGMTVIINEHHATPVAAAVAYLKAGYLNEPAEARGVSRLLERVVAGTVPGSSTADARLLASSIRSGTSLDSTYYQIITSPSKFKDALAIQSEMLQKPSLAPEQLQREAALLIEEIKWRGAPPISDGAKAFTRMLDEDYEPSALARTHLYKMGLAGGRVMPLTQGAEGIRAITRDQVAAFHRDHYKPENLVISIAGNVPTFNTLVEIQRLYGDFKAAPTVQPEALKPAPVTASRISNQAPKSSPEPAPAVADGPAGKPPVEPDQPRLRYAAERGDISQSIVTIGYEVPGLSSKEWPALEILSAILGQGRGSWLYRALLDEQKVASHTEASWVSGSDTALLTIQMFAAPDSIDKAESALFKELDAVRRELPSPGELGRAKALLEKRFLDKTADYAGRAYTLARAEAAGGGFRTATGYRDRIRAVTAEEVQRVAAKYLTLTATSLHEYEPLTAPPRSFDSERYAATVSAWAPGFAQPVSARGSRASEADPAMAVVPQGEERTADQQSVMESVEPLPLKDFSTLNGPRAFVREDHSQPVVTITMLFGGGRAVEDASTSGTTELMLRAMLYGGARRTPGQIAQELEQLGGEVDLIVEPDFFGLSIGVLSRNADRTLRILREMIEDPAFRDEDIDRARLIQVGAIRASHDSSAQLARELLLQSLFPDHPYSLPPHGREEVIAKLKNEQLREWHDRTIKQQFPLAIIVGDTDGSALVSGQIAEGFRRRDADKAIQIKIPQQSKPAEKTARNNRGFTALSLGIAAPRISGADLNALEVIAAVLNGSGGQSLSPTGKQTFPYRASLDYGPFLAAGVVHAHMIVSPENEKAARPLLLGEIDRMGRAGLSADLAASAKSVTTAQTLARLQSQKERALEYARTLFIQQQPSQVDAFAENISRITAEDIKRVATLYFKPASASIGIVRGATPQ